MKSIGDTLYRSIVSRMKAERLKASLSQEVLAGKLGKPQNYISKIERFERRMDVAEFIRIARIIGIDPSSIMDEAAE